MVFDIGCLRVKLMFSCGNYDTHPNKRKSDVSERILVTKTNVCLRSAINVPLQPSGGASVDEYECVQTNSLADNHWRRIHGQSGTPLFTRFCQLSA